MRITDIRCAADAAFVRQTISKQIVCAVNLTGQPVAAFSPFNDRGWRLERSRYFHQSLTAGFTLKVLKLRRATNEGAVNGDPGLAIHTTAEQFKTSNAITTYNGTLFVKKAATTALTFTAAHVITASLFGIILVELDDDGTIDTRVPLATQAYASAALALATLPALMVASLAAGSVPIGYIEIENNAGDWTANTDDLTDASDLTTAAFTSFADCKLAPAGASPTLAGIQDQAEYYLQEIEDAVAFGVGEAEGDELGSGATSPTLARTGTANDMAVVLCTTDADGANLNAQLDLTFRPYPLHGETV